uniref:UBR-type domain-containing protein n=1 Tax=Steinernema glaseri TaxID=37863 RepID=A0A1I7ZYV0_9BILA
MLFILSSFQAALAYGTMPTSNPLDIPIFIYRLEEEKSRFEPFLSNLRLRHRGKSKEGPHRTAEDVLKFVQKIVEVYDEVEPSFFSWIRADKMDSPNLPLTEPVSGHSCYVFLVHTDALYRILSPTNVFLLHSEAPVEYQPVVRQERRPSVEEPEQVSDLEEKETAETKPLPQNGLDAWGVLYPGKDVVKSSKAHSGVAPLRRMITRVRCPKLCSNYLKSWICARCCGQVLFTVMGYCYCKCGSYSIEDTYCRCNFHTHLLATPVTPKTASIGSRKTDKKSEARTRDVTECAADLLLFCEMLLTLLECNVEAVSRLAEGRTVHKAFLMTSSAAEPVRTPMLLDLRVIKMHFLSQRKDYFCEVFVVDMHEDAEKLASHRRYLLIPLVEEKKQLSALVDKFKNSISKKEDEQLETTIGEICACLINSRYADEFCEFLCAAEAC